MWARIVVMHVMSFDVLVGGVVLYHLGVTIDFWKEIAYYYPSWKIGASHKTSLLVRFMGGK